MSGSILKVLVLIALILGLGAALALQQRSIKAVRAENAALRAQHAEIQALQQEIERLSKLQVDAGELERLRNEHLDLMRLRAEVTELRTQKREFDKVREENQRLRAAHAAQRPTPAQPAPDVPAEPVPAPDELPKESWAFTGYGDPAAALQSTLWAALNGDANTFLASLTPDHLARQQAGEWKDKTPEQITAQVSTSVGKVNSFRILKNEAVSPDEVLLTLFLDGLEGSDQTPRMRFQRIGAEWKFAGPARGAGE
jgi:TolA-binding protein